MSKSFLTCPFCCYFDFKKFAPVINLVYGSNTRLVFCVCSGLAKLVTVKRTCNTDLKIILMAYYHHHFIVKSCCGKRKSHFSCLMTFGGSIPIISYLDAMLCHHGITRRLEPVSTCLPTLIPFFWTHFTSKGYTNKNALFLAVCLCCEFPSVFFRCLL